MARNPLYVKDQPGGGLAMIEDAGKTTGSRFYVDSVTGTDAAGYGLTPDAPCATLDYANGLCTADKGDIIYLMPKHAETYTTTGTKFTGDIAGVRIIGLGQGADRPTFTFSHTGAKFDITANGVSIEKCLFVTGVDSVTTFATVSGADFSLINCESRDVTDKEVISDFTITGDRPTIKGLFKNGYTGGNANARVISLNGVDRALIEGCRFITKVTTAVINFVSTACTAVEIKNCHFLVDSTTDFTKNVVDTATGSTWSVYGGCFDLAAGSGFSGSSGAALAGDDISSVSSSVVSVGVATSTANSSALSATVSLGTATSTADSTGLSATTSVGVATSTADSTSLSSTVSVGVATSTADSTSLSAVVSVGNGSDVSTALSTLTSVVQSVGTSVVTLCSN